MIRISLFVIALVSSAAMIGCATSESETGASAVKKTSPDAVATTQRSVELAASDSSIRFERFPTVETLPTYASGRDRGLFSIVESLGGGAALIDFDRDGTIDLFAPGGGTFDEAKNPQPMPNRLLRRLPNASLANASFVTDVTKQAGVAEAAHFSHGVAAGDMNNDGFVDLLTTGYGGVQLWRNLGDGTFEEVSQSVGINDNAWSTSAAWGDLDGDASPDLYICHYVDWSPSNDPQCPGPGGRDVCSPIRFQGVQDIVYLSNADGTFRKAADELQLAPRGKGLAVTFVDVDRDTDLDVYVANDTTPNFFYRNTVADDTPSKIDKGLLVESGLFSGLALDDMARPTGSMGIAVVDANHDARPDLFVTNYENELFSLYQGTGNCSFRHTSRRAGLQRLGQSYVGFGCVSADFDIDGDEDIVVANGHAIYFPVNSSYKQRPLLLEYESGKYVPAIAGPYFESAHVGRGVAHADITGNGLLDIAIIHTDAQAALLQNVSQTDGTPIVLRLVGTHSTRDAVGTHIEVTLTPSQRTLYRTVTAGESYLSSNFTDIHIGLPAGEAVEQMEVTWPSGLRENVSIDQLPRVGKTARLVIESRTGLE